jgi:predicted ATPase/DNA-binding XRE family transcriptional regulator
MTLSEASFGEWLKRQRNAAGLTQKQLAHRVGCAAITLRKIEADERRPSVQIAEQLAGIFNIPEKERKQFLEFARGDWSSQPAVSKQDFPWQEPRSNLPAPVTSLIGREKEIAEIREYLSKEETRLVTLVGPPGIGKTRLGVEAARTAPSDFPDGVYFVPLASLHAPSLLAPAIAEALGYIGAKNHLPEEQLRLGIGEKRILILLDNCEHLIEDVATLASDLLSACPRLKIIATSREVLRVPGEWLFPVPPLDTPKEDPPVDEVSTYPSLMLFVERARAISPGFVVTGENIGAISTICAKLDGLPLAIELIAARMRLMTPQILLERLNEGFILTADGPRAAPTRQKTLGNAIAWSYNLLTEEEQELFACLSIFSGTFTSEMAEAAFGRFFTGTPVSELFISLFDKSLIQRAANDNVGIRHTMLATVQEFARERLRQNGRETQMRDLHLAYFLDLTNGADRGLRGHDQMDWLHRLSAVVDNLRAALDWGIESGQTEAALRLVRNLDWFWFIRADHNEAIQWFQRALAMPQTSQYPEAHAEALYQLAHHTWFYVGDQEARVHAEQALSIARARNDKHNTARALSMLGLILANEQKYEETQTVLAESRELYREVNDEWGVAHATIALGQAPAFQGDFETALRFREQSLALFRELGDRYFISTSLRGLGDHKLKLGDLQGGMEAIKVAMLVARQLESKLQVTYCIWNFYTAAHMDGKPARAVRLFWAAKSLFDSFGAWSDSHGAAHASNLDSCRRELGNSAYEEEAEKGRTMTMEQAIAYALENK